MMLVSMSVLTSKPLSRVNPGCYDGSRLLFLTMEVDFRAWDRNLKRSRGVRSFPCTELVRALYGDYHS